VSSDLLASILAVWSLVQLNVASSFENPAIRMLTQFPAREIFPSAASSQMGSLVEEFVNYT
jgi:hypothetical protein